MWFFSNNSLSLNFLPQGRIQNAFKTNQIFICIRMSWFVIITTFCGKEEKSAKFLPRRYIYRGNIYMYKISYVKTIWNLLSTWIKIVRKYYKSRLNAYIAKTVIELELSNKCIILKCVVVQYLPNLYMKIYRVIIKPLPDLWGMPFPSTYCTFRLLH